MNIIQQYFTKQFLNAFLLIAALSGCNNQSSNESAQTTETTETVPPQNQLIFEKLIGTWQSHDGKSFERWKKDSSGTYQSDAFSVKGNDTSWNEHARIYPEKEKWIFENTVKGQNDGKPARFESTSLNESSVQFSNPAHDFPTDINYSVPNANTVKAFIIGPGNKGGRDTIPFNYTRVH